MVICPRNAAPDAPPGPGGAHQVSRLEALPHQHADRCRVHPKVIQDRLGHATIAETMDTHGHLFPDASEQGRGAIDAMFARSDVRPDVRHKPIMTA